MHRNSARSIYWSFEDPAAVQGSEEERNAAFRKVQDQNHVRFKAFLTA
ncbi:MAG: hypothetical protein LAO79_04810 [Acidobacteriia bacterium]|nr:hypothetical protein [Terriglobia bacterium]